MGRRRRLSLGQHNLNLLRLGGGAWLNKNIGLFAGAQYSYTLVETRHEDAGYSTILGDNQ